MLDAHAMAGGPRLLDLDEPWRRFAICFRAAGSLPPAAALLVQHLEAQGQSG